MPNQMFDNPQVITNDMLREANRKPTYEDALGLVLDEIKETILRRHKRYGHNLLRHGEMGIIIRVDDKTERIKNMIEAKEDDAEEPREQTWIDVAGYAVQAIMIGRGDFILPMRS